MSKPKNASLAAASKAKEDEFFTQITDIERELKYYKDHLLLFHILLLNL